MKFLVHTVKSDGHVGIKLANTINELSAMFGGKKSANQGIINTHKLAFLLGNPEEVVVWEDGSETRFLKFVAGKSRGSSEFNSVDLLAFYVHAYADACNEIVNLKKCAL